jgi:hypothetical protein
MKYISPKPNTWYAIYQNLKSHYEKEIKVGMAPPIALVLSGWTFSNDYDKEQRWKETLAWAKKNNCQHLIHELKEEEKYYVQEYSSFRPYEYYTYDTKYKPIPEEVNHAMQTLLTNWDTIWDSAFAPNTQPLAFTGNKRRRLLVAYNSMYQPPWGSWHNHLASGRPSKFTELRLKINELIKPIVVDHIDFKEKT